MSHLWKSKIREDKKTILKVVLEDQSGNYTLLFSGEIPGEEAQGKSVRKKVVF